jgi:hypothetical protein
MGTNLPEILAVIQTVLLEAIKVLGPAAIAAYFTFRATSVQYESKLRELERGNEFSARDRLFSLYTGRLKELDEETEKLNSAVGQMIGMSSVSGDTPTPDERRTLEALAGFARTTARQFPLQARAILKTMENHDLKESEEYTSLNALSAKGIELSPSPSYEELRAGLFSLLEAHHVLTGCTRTLLERNALMMFEQYVKTDALAKQK